MLIPTIILGWWAISWARGVAKWSEKADEFPTIAELRGPAIPDAENAALVYQQAWEALELTDEQQELLRQTEDPEKLAPILEANSEALRLLHEAAGMERCRFPTDRSLAGLASFPRMLDLRKLERLSGARARYRSAQGDVAGALADINTLVATAAHLLEASENYMLWISGRIPTGIASDAMEKLCSTHNPTGEQSRALRQSLLTMEPREGFVRMLKFEYRWTGQYARHRAPELPFGLDQIPLVLDTARRTRMMTRLLKRAETPYWQHVGRAPIGDPGGDLWDVHISVLEDGILRRDEWVAMKHQAILALDIEAFIVEHGTPPPSLDELPASDEADYALDPFSGERLRYKPGESGGYTLWSIGRDLDDDGGISRVEAREAGRESGDYDLVFRVEPAD